MLRKSWMQGAALVGCTVLWFAMLTQRPLFDPDEGRYAEIPREMLNSGDWLIPHLNALAYLEKPPLQYWLTALAYRGFGQNEFAARLCTGVAGYLSLLTVYLLGLKLWGPDAGFRALSFTAASMLFVLLGHQLTPDMLLSFALLAALGCFLMAQRRRDRPREWRPWMLGCWAAMAFAVLTKGLIGVLIPVATLGGYVMWQGDWLVLRRLHISRGLPLFAALAVPWFVLAARANPRFLAFFFVREHFQRFLTPIEHRTQPWWFFAPVLVAGILPWLPQALRALAAAFVRRVPRGQYDAARVLWVWCVFTLIFFSLSDSKLVTYILPVIPALALLCACHDIGQNRGSLLAGALLSLGASLGVLAYTRGLWRSVDSQALLPLVRPMLLATCALFAMGAAACAWCARNGRPRAALASLSIAWFLASATVLVAANAAQSLFSAKDMALAVRREAAAAGAAGVAGVPAGVPIFAVQSYQQSLLFYLRRPVILVDYRDEFDFGLTQDPQRGIATLQQFAQAWLPLERGFAIMPPATLDKLTALRVPMREIERFPDRVLVRR
jgi:4-amino-4-deoxy-L-arabinose transferase-like glycosyltransferase